MATDTDADLQNPDVDARAIVMLVAGFLIFAAISGIGLRFYYMHAHVGLAIQPLSFPEPRLETRNGQDLDALQKRQRGQDYVWRDRERGLVRIPLARAMEIIASRGAGAYDQLETPAPTPGPTSAAAPASPSTPSLTPAGAPQ